MSNKIKINPRGVDNNTEGAKKEEIIDKFKAEFEPKIKRTPFAFNGINESEKPSGVYDKNNKPIMVPCYTNGSYMIAYNKFKNDLKKRLIPSTALSILLCILDRIDYACNYTEVTMKELAFETDLDITTVNRSIQLLVDKNLISKRNRSGYIINHNYCLNGSLTMFVENYKKLYPDEFNNEEI